MFCRSLNSILLASFFANVVFAVEYEVSFSDVLKHARQATRPVVLASADKQSQVLVVPELQGRVLASTANGLAGRSYGWVNLKAFTDPQQDPGGADRLWLGPMGTQYSLFFAPGVPFEEENWRVPPCIAKGRFEIGEQSEDSLTLRKEIEFENHQGQQFLAMIKRQINLFSREAIAEQLVITLPQEVDAVGFESVNEIRNTGTRTWNPETGLVTLWSLGMFSGTDSTTVVVPVRNEATNKENLRTYLYPLDKSRIVEREGNIFFRGDGRYRSKIGVGPRRALPVSGSYDAEYNVLTIIKYSLGETTSYVSHSRGPQAKPYEGDVVNSYNNGAMDGSIADLATFYELESSSPARPCKPDESITHTHQTYHFEGDSDALDPIAKRLLGCSLDEISRALVETE